LVVSIASTSSTPHGFVEFDRYVLDGETAEYVDLYLET